jgi:hypothetical protein
MQTLQQEVASSQATPKFAVGEFLKATNSDTIYCGVVVQVERVSFLFGEWTYQCKLIYYPTELRRKHLSNAVRQDWLLIESELIALTDQDKALLPKEASKKPASVPKPSVKPTTTLPTTTARTAPAEALTTAKPQPIPEQVEEPPPRFQVGDRVKSLKDGYDGAYGCEGVVVDHLWGDVKVQWSRKDGSSFDRRESFSDIALEEVL